MKSNKIFFSALIILTVLLAGSCKKSFFTGVNVNPNVPKEVAPNLILPTAEAALGYTQGGDIFASTAASLLGRGVTRDTEFDRGQPLILPGVLASGAPNNIQISSTQAYYGNSITNGAASESAVYDATCIRLREASLSYNVPTKALTKMPFGSVSISLTGSNLWYFAPNMPKYVHFDPDVNGLGVGNGRGFDLLSGPSTRRYGASIRVTF